MVTKAEEIHNRLRVALEGGDADQAESLTREALAAGTDPLALVQETLVPTLTEVGDRFQRFELFLPELMMAGEAAERVSAVVEEALPRSEFEALSLGTVVIGQVKGDLHDIGRNIVRTLLSSHGFKVIDLGHDVRPSAFLEAADREKADIVALSALMTTTLPAQKQTIQLFTEVGKRESTRIIIGGGAASEPWAEEIGADGYAEDAAGAVALCKKLLTATTS